MQDTLQVLSDSAKLALDSIQRRDSVLFADSIARADSIAYADSVRLHAFKGYEGITAIGVPSDQNWVFVLLLFLFGLLVLAFVRSIVSPVQNIIGYYTSKERNSIFSKTSIDSFEQKLYFLVFSIFTFALLGQLLFFEQGHSFELLIYSKYLLVVVLFFVVKYLLIKVVEYVFIDKNTMKLLTDSYLNMLALVSVCVYVLILFHLYTYSDYSDFTAFAALIIVSLGLLMFSIRLIQIFLHKIVDSLYLMLYLCTLEILPVLVIVQVFREIATNV